MSEGVSIEELVGVYAEAVAMHGPNSTSAKIASAMIIHEFDLMEAEVKRLNQEIGDTQDALQLELGESAPLRERVKALEALCLRAAGYIGVRQGPEVDQEADELLRKLRGET